MTSISENCSLFEIDTELDDILEQVETEGGPSEALLSRFREFCAAHGEKVDQIGRFVRMMEAREQFCRAEAARLGERARATANKVDRTKSMVLFYLMSRELRKIEGREFTLRIQKNSQDSVHILDEPALPMAYRKVEARIGGVLWETILSYLPEDLELSLVACIQETKPDTEAIKAAALRHEEVVGAEVRRLSSAGGLIPKNWAAHATKAYAANPLSCQQFLRGVRAAEYQQWRDHGDMGATGLDRDHCRQSGG
jgi:hypothetical protein